MNQPTSATASASASAGAATVSAARATVSPPPVWRMAWRQLQRDFRAGELRLILLAVALAITLWLTRVARRQLEAPRGVHVVAAALAMLLWVAIIFCGRFIAYIESY